MNERLEKQFVADLNSVDIYLDNEKINQIFLYINLLIKWNKTYNLTSITNPQQILKLHIIDSLLIIKPLLDKIKDYNFDVKKIKILDVGTGAGLPAIILAICIPEFKIHCVDAVSKKIAFINQVVIELNLKNITPIHNRVENLNEKYDVIISRAFSSLLTFVLLTGSILKKNGLWLAMKAKIEEAELSAFKTTLNNKYMFHVEQLKKLDKIEKRCIVWIY